MSGEDLIVVLRGQVSLRSADGRGACCERIMSASAKPRSSMTRPRVTYMTPMRLWSTLVNHSRHR